MVKTILISMNILGILILGIVQKNAIEVTQDAPHTLQPGQEAVVTVDIKKSDVSGFAKYQITLDEGLRAEVVESAGASFTFNDQKAKFIWMSLPSTKEFTLKYRIVADVEATGSLEISSRFSYIYKNERKNFDIAPHQIGIGMEGEDLATDTVQPVLAIPSNSNAMASASRLLSSAGINQWEVEVVVLKSGIEGFAKIEETIPQGYTALDLMANGAIFSLSDQTIKYIWYDLPKNETVRIRYKLLPVVAMDANEPDISGDFSYIKEEQTISLPIGRDESEMIVANTDTIKEELIAEETAADTVEPAETETNIETEPVVEIPVVVAEVTTPDTKTESAEVEPAAAEETETVETPEVEEIASTDKSPVDGNIVDVPMPETGVYYRVQLAAGKNNVKKDEFSKTFAFNEGLKLENISGWFKYTTGHHQVYKAARDDRTRITAKYEKFNGPFVTAYNDGERISVQEALMITSQKWYQ